MSEDNRQPEEGPAQVPVMWREYIIRLPKQLADTLDKALGMQKQMEDREIENSEYWAWLLMLGLNEVAKQNALAQEADKRVLTAPDMSLKELRAQPKAPVIRRGPTPDSWDVTL